MRVDGFRHPVTFLRPALLLCLILAQSGLARAERLPVKTYTVGDGLQRDNVTRIRQDSRGFLWLCTAEGVSRFDGAGMTNFTVADSLPDRFVEDFLETKDGTIYIATRKGLARLNPYGLRASEENPLFTVFLPDNGRAEKILTLFEDKNNQVWVGTSDGLYKLIQKDGQAALEVVNLGKPLIETLYVNEVIEDRRGALWIATADSGLYRLSPGGDVRHFTTGDKLADNNVVSLLEDRDGQIWAGYGGGLCLLDAEAVEKPVKKCYSYKDGLPSNWILDLLQTSDGKFWLAATSGLCLWQGEGGASLCKTYTAKNDLCDTDIWSIAEDKDGNLWVGSRCGAKKIARYGFTIYTETDGLDYAAVNSIFENRAGELFISTSRNKRAISRFDGDKFSMVKPRLPDYVNYYGWGWQQTVWQDAAGAWWIPTGWGLFRTPPTDFENLARVSAQKQETGAKGFEVFRLFEDSRGDIWIAVAFNELWRWERATGVWHDYTAQIGLSQHRLISAFVEDQHGNIWIGTGSDESKQYYEGLLIRYRDGRFRVFTHAEGAPRGWTRDLFLDSRGRLWIASTEDGLLRLDDTNADQLEFTHYTPANGLTSNATACVTEDEFGRIYVGTWRGIDRLDPDTGQIENFTTADGLPGSFVENAYRDRNNNLWFATYGGLARFRPEPVRQRKPPTILITGLRVEGESQSVSILGETEISNLELGPDQRQVSVDFLGLGATLGEKLKYEYRFGDSEWTQTNERTVNFANLAAGAYQFQVRAVTADRLSSPTPATLVFRIAAPIWQRWWFLTSAAVLMGLVLYSIYRYQLAQRLKVERVRTRIATDLHDDIGANLSLIAMASDVARRRSREDDRQMSEALSLISGTSRELVDSMGDIVWAINPNRDRLVDLIKRMRRFASDLLSARGIAFRFEAPADERDVHLGTETRREVLLIFKEAVNNIARHSGCSEADIELKAQSGWLILKLSDNGKGFDTTQVFDGSGLQSMGQRAERLGGRLEVISRNGGGTTVTLKTPLK